jgi:DNA-binding transcriptional MerR regulator
MPNRYTSKTLGRASGVSVRTLHEWIRKKVLAPPLGGGRGAHYNETHLAAARVIRHMRASGLPLNAIRARITGRSVAELQALLPAALQPDMTPAIARLASNPTELIRPARIQTVQIVELMEGLTLTVDAERSDARRVAEEIYRRYVAAEPP